MDASVASARRKWAAAVVIVALAALMAPSDADGQVRLSVPEESLSGPFYARLERGLVLQTDEWVGIAFYRDPVCVRQNFNLLNFFDFGNIPGIFSCPLTVSGFELWSDPAADLAPRQSRLHGNGAVPVWFVSVEDFRAALPGITVDELLAMPSLMQAVADDFEETLHPLEGAEQSSLRLVASGHLPDGRTFRFVAIEAAGELRHVGIEFR
jgi:hypothetical protein